MVNNLNNVGKFQALPVPNNIKTGRIKVDGPLYSKEETLAMIGQITIRPATRTCTLRTQELGLDSQESLKEFLRDALFLGQYIDSEWCALSLTSCAACDAYCFKRKEENYRMTTGFMEIEYFVKYAISKVGTVMLLVSCHT
jgi:hypothetical protein